MNENQTVSVQSGRSERTSCRPSSTCQREQQPNLLGEVGNGLIYCTLHRRLLVEALAPAMDVALAAPPPLEAPSTERAWLFDAALAQIGEIIVPRSDDSFVIGRSSKGLARILKYLREAAGGAR